MPDPATGAVSDALPVEVYSNPARPISAGVVQSIVADFATGYNRRSQWTGADRAK